MGRVIKLSAKPLWQLRIELMGIKPVIWRRVLVPGTITLGKLHQVIQEAMGWLDVHLHEFDINDVRFGEPDPEWDTGDVISEKRVKLKNALEGTATFHYMYDFGDGWNHRIKVEKVLPPDSSLKSPLCIDGANACPPEDVGGVYGYMEFLEAIANPENPESQRMLDWCGKPDFNPTYFDTVQTNINLDRIKI